MAYQILITNDDGVGSSGILAAYEAVKDLGYVTIVAPATQQSAVGRSMTLFEPLRISKHNINGVAAYGVSGTPTDSVILGMFTVLDKMPDLVISGINIGENLSAEAATTSGTIGAALEASNHGVPSIAVSIRVEDDGDKFMDTNYKRNYAEAINVIRKIAKKVLEDGMPEGVDVLNVNIPSNVTSDTGVIVTTLARKMYDTKVHHRYDPRGRSYYWIGGGIIDDAPEGTDVHTILKLNKISITPLTVDMTRDISIGHLEKMMKELF